MVMIGRYDSGTPPAPVSGDHTELRVNVRGEPIVEIAAGTAAIGVVDTEMPTAAALADATANPTVPAVGTFPHGFNTATWDRWQNNHERTVLTSAARTASVDSADLVNYNARGGVFVIDVTALAATPSLVFTIQGKSSLGSDYYTILASAAIIATGVTVLRVYPGMTVSATLAVSDVLPRIFRVSVAAGNADSITYSISVNLIV